MILTKKIVITDTNIITDLYVGNLLEEFINLENIYVLDLIKKDELNEHSCNKRIYNNIKTIVVNNNEILEAYEVNKKQPKLSFYDALNYVVAKNRKYFLATGDKRLRNYSIDHNLKTIRTLKIIKEMFIYNIIDKEKAVKCCNNLLDSPKTRIPHSEILKIIDFINKK